MAKIKGNINEVVKATNRLNKQEAIAKADASFWYRSSKDSSSAFQKYAKSRVNPAYARVENIENQKSHVVDAFHGKIGATAPVSGTDYGTYNIIKKAGKQITKLNNNPIRKARFSGSIAISYDLGGGHIETTTRGKTIGRQKGQPKPDPNSKRSKRKAEIDARESEYQDYQTNEIWKERP